MPKKTKAMIKKEQQAMELFEGVKGDGFEETDKDAFAIPFLRILQSNSPQVNEDEDAYIPRSKAGMFFNNVSGDLFGKVTQVIPVHYTRSFIEWMPDRGGFVLDHGPDPSAMEDAERDEKNKMILPNGNIIQDTRNHFVLVLTDEGTLDPLIFPLYGTGIKHSRKWMSIMKALKMPNEKSAPMFSSVYELQTVLNKNDEGSWYQIGDKGKSLIKRVAWVDADQLLEIKQYRELIIAGKAKADFASMEDTPLSEEDPEY